MKLHRYEEEQSVSLEKENQHAFILFYTKNTKIKNAKI